MSDNVKSPNHYANSCSIECIESMLLAFGLNDTITFCKLNAYKYIWRYKNKNGIEDLHKAEQYLNFIGKFCYDNGISYPSDYRLWCAFVEDKLEEAVGEQYESDICDVCDALDDLAETDEELPF